MAMALSDLLLSKNYLPVLLVEEDDYPDVALTFSHYTELGPIIRVYSGTPSSLRRELEEMRASLTKKGLALPEMFVSTLQMFNTFDTLSPLECQEEDLRLSFSWAVNAFMRIRELVSFLKESYGGVLEGAVKPRVLAVISISADVPMEYQLRLSLAEAILKNLLMSLKLELSVRGKPPVELIGAYPGLADVSFKEQIDMRFLRRTAEELLELLISPPELERPSVTIGKVKVIL